MYLTLYVIAITVDDQVCPYNDKLNFSMLRMVVLSLLTFTGLWEMLEQIRWLLLKAWA